MPVAESATSAWQLPLRPGLTRTLSARTPTTLPGAKVTRAETEFSSSESILSETESEHERRLRRERRTRSPDCPSLPSLLEQRRMTGAEQDKIAIGPMRSRRESLRSGSPPRSGKYIDHSPSASRDYSDRTAHAELSERRSTTSSARNSHRPSVSTRASSDRSSAGSGGYYKVVIEDKNGRLRTAYLSKEQQSDMIRRTEQTRP